MIEHSYIKRAEESCIWRIVDDETIIISKDGEFLHRLNEVGTEIWRLADGSLTFDQLIYRICSMFDVDEENMKRDLRAFIEKLSALELIEIHDEE